MFSIVRLARKPVINFLNKESNMLFQVAILDDYQHVAKSMTDWSLLHENASVTAYHDHFQTDAALIEALQDKHVVIIMRERTRFHENIFSNLPNLKLLVTSGLKNDAIDLAAAQKHGVVVSGTRSLKEPPAELAIGLMLALARHIPQENQSFKNGGVWQSSLGVSLYGKTIGILGLGYIGAITAKITQALGMKVIAWSQNLTAEKAAEHNVELAASKQELLQKSDVISIHLRLSDRTKNLIDVIDFELMKHSALIINTSRAEIINQEALISALNSKRIAGAASDVFECEPLPENHPLRVIENFIGTPHLGYVTDENYQYYFSEAVEDINAYLSGKPLRELYSSNKSSILNV